MTWAAAKNAPAAQSGGSTAELLKLARRSPSARSGEQSQPASWSGQRKSPRLFAPGASAINVGCGGAQPPRVDPELPNLTCRNGTRRAALGRVASTGATEIVRHDRASTRPLPPRPRSRDFSCANDAVAYGRNAQQAVIRRRLGQRAKSDPKPKFLLHLAIGTFRRQSGSLRARTGESLRPITLRLLRLGRKGDCKPRIPTIRTFCATNSQCAFR
jgi:hypothetical protein